MVSRYCTIDLILRKRSISYFGGDGSSNIVRVLWLVTPRPSYLKTITKSTEPQKSGGIRGSAPAGDCAAGLLSLTMDHRLVRRSRYSETVGKGWWRSDVSPRTRGRIDSNLERALVMPEPWMAQPNSRVSTGCPIDDSVLIGTHGD